MLFPVQKATFLPTIRQDGRNLSGVDDHGTSDIDMLRQLRRSYRSFRVFFFEEYGEQAYKASDPNA